MSTDQVSAPVIRRLGDVIQGLAVIAIAGLVVVVIDLRITIVQNQDMINSQDKLHSQNVISLRENIKLQMKVLEAVVHRVNNNGFSVSQGLALQERVKLLHNKIEKHDEEIKKIYEKFYSK